METTGIVGIIQGLLYLFVAADKVVAYALPGVLWGWHLVLVEPEESWRLR